MVIYDPYTRKIKVEVGFKARVECRMTDGHDRLQYLAR